MQYILIICIGIQSGANGDNSNSDGDGNSDGNGDGNSDGIKST